MFGIPFSAYESRNPITGDSLSGVFIKNKKNNFPLQVFVPVYYQYIILFDTIIEAPAHSNFILVSKVSVDVVGNTV